MIYAGVIVFCVFADIPLRVIYRKSGTENVCGMDSILRHTIPMVYVHMLCNNEHRAHEHGLCSSEYHLDAR